MASFDALERRINSVRWYSKLQRNCDGRVRSFPTVYQRTIIQALKLDYSSNATELSVVYHVGALTLLTSVVVCVLSRILLDTIYRKTIRSLKIFSEICTEKIKFQRKCYFE